MFNLALIVMQIFQAQNHGMGGSQKVRTVSPIHGKDASIRSETPQPTLRGQANQTARKGSMNHGVNLRGDRAQVHNWGEFPFLRHRCGIKPPGGMIHVLQTPGIGRDVAKDSVPGGGQRPHLHA